MGSHVYMELNRAIRSHVEPYGTIWNHIDLYEVIWTHMELYWTIWNHIEPYIRNHIELELCAYHYIVIPSGIPPAQFRELDWSSWCGVGGVGVGGGGGGGVYVGVVVVGSRRSFISIFFRKMKTKTLKKIIIIAICIYLSEFGFGSSPFFLLPPFFLIFFPFSFFHFFLLKSTQTAV